MPLLNPDVSDYVGTSVCVLISGKRKCGKDYVAHLLETKFAEIGVAYVVVRLSLPIKSHFASSHNLDLENLLSSGPYKETYRREMVSWGESQMQKDPYIFAREALESSLREFGSAPNIVLVTDARRSSDVKFFTEVFGRSNCVLIRISASKKARADRGWIYTECIDDATTECGLDTFSGWDYCVENSVPDDHHVETLDRIVRTIFGMMGCNGNRGIPIATTG